VTFTLGLAGDTMLGRHVAEAIERRGVDPLFSAEVVDAAHKADLFVLNLECCISTRGTRWSAPGKSFFFRAPPEAVDALARLGVDCVNLANNHALDFGDQALADTRSFLTAGGIASVGAGPDVDTARSPAFLDAAGSRLAVLGLTDHPDDFAAGPGRPGVALADLRRGLPAWVPAAIEGAARNADLVLVTPHWGPNMVSEPVPRVRAAGPELLHDGADLVAGHSAHVFHGVEPGILWDLGDFVDDYAMHPELRNDLGLLWLVRIGDEGPEEVEGVPLALDYCHTRLAVGEDAAWVRGRFRDACSALGTATTERDGRVVVTLRRRAGRRSVRAECPPRRESACGDGSSEH
jgi:poly-gamma-glutamate synthesis protein (capsule biosynthesis protein)